MKRLILIAVLALPLVGISNQAVASAPIPGCYPCKPTPPEPPPASPVLPSDAR